MDWSSQMYNIHHQIGRKTISVFLRRWKLSNPQKAGKRSSLEREENTLIERTKLQKIFNTNQFGRPVSNYIMDIENLAQETPVTTTTLREVFINGLDQKYKKYKDCRTFQDAVNQLELVSLVKIQKKWRSQCKKKKKKHTVECKARKSNDHTFTPGSHQAAQAQVTFQ